MLGAVCKLRVQTALRQTRSTVMLGAVCRLRVRPLSVAAHTKKTSRAAPPLTGNALTRYVGRKDRPTHLALFRMPSIASVASVAPVAPVAPVARVASASPVAASRASAAYTSKCEGTRCTASAYLNKKKYKTRRRRGKEGEEEEEEDEGRTEKGEDAKCG